MPSETNKEGYRSDYGAPSIVSENVASSVLPTG